jgi:hypothetical protein
MTVNRPKPNASLFESIGGMKRLAKYANESDENFAVVLKLLGPRIFEMGASDNADKADPKRLEEFMRLHESVVQHRVNDALAQQAAATSVTDDASAGVAKPDEQHAIPQTPQVTPQVSNPNPDSVPAQASNPTSTPVIAAPLTPEQARALAMAPLPQPVKEGPTSTELFLQWNESQRMTWSADRSWSGW